MLEVVLVLVLIVLAWFEMLEMGVRIQARRLVAETEQALAYYSN